MTATATNKSVTLISCTNMAASGILVQGKQISDDWQVHAEGCRDLKEMQSIFGRVARHAFQKFDSLVAARDNFNAEMGAGGSAGFTDEEGGWDFNRDVSVKPCCK